ncbi:DM13 domain-containing protein [Pleurocapsales cyanobacterium LEGE 10410]|nr:DM13 domain-containing protein [Pleurocapsales cyanobacterium LEGE 10410]
MQRLSLSLVVTLIVGVAASTSINALTSEKYQSSSQTANTSLIATKTSAGQFVSVEHPTQGQVKVIEEDGAQYLEISEDFQSDRGPALEVILHKSNTVGLQIQEGDYISLGELKAFNGTQRYLIPEDVDLGQYQSVAIWCEEFNATFGYAPLAQ